MRFLFRLLDEDGGGSLSAEEIKKGMLLLGFPEAEDPVVLGRLVQNIDEDQTGTISESEFLSFMSNESRQSLKDKMAKWSLQHTYIFGTRYPIFGEVDVETAELSCATVQELIRKMAHDDDSKHNYWLDMVGYDRPTFTSLASVLGISHDSLADTLLVTGAACRYIPDATIPTSCIIIHHAKLSVQPILPRAASCLPGPVAAVIDAVIGGDSVNIKPPEILRGRQLASKEDIVESAVTLEQVISFHMAPNTITIVWFSLPVAKYSQIYSRDPA
jgi:hypothetical protein